MFIPPSIPAGLAIVVLPPLAGYWLARRIARRRSDVLLGNVLARLPLTGFLLGLALLLPVALGLLAANARVALRLPLAIQYWGPSLTWIAVVALLGGLSFFAVGLAYAERHAERRKLLLAAALLSGTFTFVQFYYTRPLAPALVAEAAPDGAILQSSDASCAPASGANVARRLGVAIGEGALAAAMHTTRMFGTSVPQVVVGMASAGLACRTVLLEQAATGEIALPAILFVDHWAVGPEGHAVALLDKRDGGYEVIDPLSGREHWSREQLDRVWHGMAVTCQRESRRQG